MARVINGINGGFTGKVGTVTSYTRNRASFMRSGHRDKDNIKSEANRNVLSTKPSSIHL